MKVNEKLYEVASFSEFFLKKCHWIVNMPCLICYPEQIHTLCALLFCIYVFIFFPRLGVNESVMSY